MKHLIETTDLSSLATVRYDRIVLNSSTNDVIVKGGGLIYEVIPDSYIYNETDNKYYQKLVAYGEPIETNATVDLNSEWVSDSEDDKYRYFKSNSNVGADESYSQCKVTWSNLTSITFKYMSSSDMGGLYVLKMDSKKFTPPASFDDIHLTTFDKRPGIYNEFTIECDEGEHHIWFCYLKEKNATDKDRGFIGVPKFVSPILDIKQGAELPMEYKSGGVSVEDGKTYDINYKSVILPNGSYIVHSYEDYTKTEKTITYEYVDLGLSVKWAKCNVGATSETEDGVFFSWGETSGISGSLLGKYSDENYSWASYTHCNGSYNALKKYNNNTSYGENPDNKTTLDPEDDAASQIMGEGWRIPTKDEFQELLDNTDKLWTTINGVNGYKFTSIKEGYQNNSIFIPAAGSCGNGSVGNVGYSGYVWSSSLSASSPNNAWYLNFSSGHCYVGSYGRYDGQSVRGVRK